MYVCIHVYMYIHIYSIFILFVCLFVCFYILVYLSYLNFSIFFPAHACFLYPNCVCQSTYKTLGIAAHFWAIFLC